MLLNSEASYADENSKILHIAIGPRLTSDPVRYTFSVSCKRDRNKYYGSIR